MQKVQPSTTITTTTTTEYGLHIVNLLLSTTNVFRPRFGLNDLPELYMLNNKST